MSAPTVNDIDTDNAILVARLLRHSERVGYGEYAREALDHVGLAPLIPRESKTFSIDLSDFLAALPRTATVEVLTGSDGEPDTYGAGNQIRDIVDTHLDTAVTAVRLGNTPLSLIPDDSQAIDRDAVIEQWGDYHTPYPSAGTAEVDHHRRQLIDTLRAFGTEQRWCEELERTIERIGLGGYITEAVTIDLTELGALTVRLPVHRNGSRREDELSEQLASAITAELDRRPELIGSTRAADTAPATTR
ncbi:hypothetical protein [Nocardia sputi]|uniref:hypothetical protein n=1 Tax=Nocardia sputi TaxID=2943705 RepID=UPI0020BF89A9|nr:hypothetical protein [Nocardia sputi]